MERRILALDPGTRYLGFALFDGPRLVYHGVLTLSPHHHPARRIDEATHRIGRMIRDWRPEAAVAQFRLPGCRADMGLPEMTVAEAQKLLLLLAFDPETPPGMRNRAQRLQATIFNNAAPAAPEKK